MGGVSLVLGACVAASGCTGTAAGLTWLRILRDGRRRSDLRGDLIVVFGARAWPGGPSPELWARLHHAQTLFAGGRAPRVLCSGGRLPTHSEAVVMAEALASLGVPPEVIAVDEDGASTRETLRSVSVLHPGARVLAVSSGYHLHRILEEARRQGVRALGCPATQTPILRNPAARRRQLRYEVLATWWYGVSGAGAALARRSARRGKADR